MRQAAWRSGGGALAIIGGWGLFVSVGYADAIYKCADATGHVTYQSEPCKGGARLDIEAGRQDPAAVERLREDQAAFSARDAERREQATRAAVARDERAAAEARARTADAAPDAAAAGSCLDCGWGTVLPWWPDPWRPRPQPRPPRPRPDVKPEGTMPPIPRTTPGPPLVSSQPPPRPVPVPAAIVAGGR